MSKFKSFYNAHGVTIWLDLDDISVLSGVLKEYPDKGIIFKGRPVYRIRYALKSGITGVLDFSWKQTAYDIMTIITRELNEC
jgi:hypothetical protein